MIQSLTVPASLLRKHALCSAEYIVCMSTCMCIESNKHFASDGFYFLWEEEPGDEVT